MRFICKINKELAPVFSPNHTRWAIKHTHIHCCVCVRAHTDLLFERREKYLDKRWSFVHGWIFALSAVPCKRHLVCGLQLSLCHDVCSCPHGCLRPNPQGGKSNLLHTLQGGSTSCSPAMFSLPVLTENMAMGGCLWSLRMNCKLSCCHHHEFLLHFPPLPTLFPSSLPFFPWQPCSLWNSPGLCMCLNLRLLPSSLSINREICKRHFSGAWLWGQTRFIEICYSSFYNCQNISTPSRKHWMMNNNSWCFRVSKICPYTMY